MKYYRPTMKLEERVLLALVDRTGRWVEHDELVELVYGDDPDGGPLEARNCLSVAVFKLRRRHMGVIWTRHGYGFCWTPTGMPPPPTGNLTPTQQRLVDIFESREVATFAALNAVLPSAHDDRNDQRVRANINVHVLHIRRRRPDLRIDNVWGVGFRLAEAEADERRAA